MEDSAPQALLDAFRVFAYYGPVLADVDGALASGPPEIQLGLQVLVIAVDRKVCEFAAAGRGGGELGRGFGQDQLLAGQADGFHSFLQVVDCLERSAIRRRLGDSGSRTSHQGKSGDGCGGPGSKSVHG